MENVFEETENHRRPLAEGSKGCLQSENLSEGHHKIIGLLKANNSSFSKMCQVCPQDLAVLSGLLAPGGGLLLLDGVQGPSGDGPMPGSRGTLLSGGGAAEGPLPCATAVDFTREKPKA